MMGELSQREKELGYCEEAQTYCSVAEDRYQQGKSDGAREFAEWFSNTEYVTSPGHFILPLRGYFTIDDVVSEWERLKEQK